MFETTEKTHFWHVLEKRKIKELTTNSQKDQFDEMRMFLFNYCEVTVYKIMNYK